VKNTADDVLYVTFTSVSRAPVGTTVPAEANGLKLAVSYKDASGNDLKATAIPQGTEFTAVVRVTNPTQADYRSLALSERIPSGWEILNDRMRGGNGDADASYRDIRDDRCNWFFDLPHGATKTFTLKLRAAYEGSYTLPAITCSAMYNPQVAANTESKTTSVTR
jgi:Large extracellular alpha-helical protein